MSTKPSKIIDIIAPSGTFPENVLHKISKYLEEQGLNARIPENILGKDLLCANTDEQRAKLLQQAILSNDSNFIWSARGGYGLTKLIPTLKNLKPNQQKTFLGFSDATALHLFATQEWGWHTIHGPSAKQVVEHNVSKESLDKVHQIFAGNFTCEYTLNPINQAAKNIEIKAELTGGNLAIIEAGLGTCWHINTNNKILMLEEANEWTYRIERALVHLQQCDVFKNIKALILGNFSHESDREEQKTKTMLERFANQQDFPIFHTNVFGHGTENCAWSYNTATLSNNRLKQS